MLSSAWRKSTRGLSAICGIALWPFAGEVRALEEQSESLPASVEVAPVFGVSLDQPSLAFGALRSDTPTVLGSGRFFNEVRCRSNSGRPWYLKAHLLSLKDLERQTVVPPASLKWKIVESTGAADMVGRGDFQPFAEEPVLFYASEGDDHRGREVVLRLQYSLDIPPEAPAGNYVGQIVFTMAENP